MFGFRIESATGFSRLPLGLFLVAPGADALQVVERMVVAGLDVIHLD